MSELTHKFIDSFLKSSVTHTWNESVMDAIDTLPPSVHSEILFLLDEASLGWKYILPFRQDSANALIIGNDFGVSCQHFCKTHENVVAIRQDSSEVEFLKMVGNHFDLRNLTIVRSAFDGVLPFQSNSFDTLIGFFPDVYLPTKKLSSFVDEVNRVLTEKGSFLWFVRNRYNYNYLRQRLSFSSTALPCQSGSYFTYRRILNTPPFKDVSCFSIYSDAGSPRQLIQYGKNKDICPPGSKGLKSHIKSSPLFTDLFIFKASKPINSSSFLKEICSEIVAHLNIPSQSKVEILNCFLSLKGNTIVTLSIGTPLPKKLIVKLPATVAAEQHDHANYCALETIHGSEEISPIIKSLIPLPVLNIKFLSQLVFVEEYIDGISPKGFAFHSDAIEDIIRKTSDLITALHQQTATENTISEKFIHSQLSNRINTIKNVIDVDFLAQFNTIVSYLISALSGTRMPLVRRHGDLSIGSNVLVDPSCTKLKGIIDWDLSEKDSFPLVDLLNLIESYYQNFRKYDLGRTVTEILFPMQLSNFHSRLVDKYTDSIPLSRDMVAPMSLIYWIYHISAQMDYPFFALNKTWQQANIYSVIERIVEQL